MRRRTLRPHPTRQCARTSPDTHPRVSALTGGGLLQLRERAKCASAHVEGAAYPRSLSPPATSVAQRSHFRNLPRPHSEVPRAHTDTPFDSSMAPGVETATTACEMPAAQCCSDSVGTAVGPRAAADPGRHSAESGRHTLRRNPVPEGPRTRAHSVAVPAPACRHVIRHGGGGIGRPSQSAPFARISTVTPRPLTESIYT